MKNYMRISELVRRSGVPKTTIHYYLREGLLHQPIKTGRTMAYYDETHLKRLQLINRLRVEKRLPVMLLKEGLEEAEKTGGNPWERLPAEPGVEARPDAAGSGRRQEIVEAAIKIFSRKGFHQTKVQDITRSIGISTGTFYIYFKNKRDLFVEVVDEVFRTIVGEAAKALQEEDDVMRRLVIRGEVFYKNYSKYNEILYQLRAEMAGEDAWPHDRVKEAYKQLTRPVIREVQDGINKGIFRPADPDLMAYALTGIIEIMSLRISLDDKYSFADIMNFIVEFVSHGLDLDYGRE